MTDIRCMQCQKPFILELHRNPQYKGTVLCPTCLDMRKLLDGLFIDLNIKQIEAMILEDPDISKISRDITTVN